MEPQINIDKHGLIRVKQRSLRPRALRPQNANLNRAGRPKGRYNKVHDDIASFARQYGPECIANLVHIMRTNPDNPDVVIRCCDLLLMRGYGRAPAAISLSGPNGGPIDFRSLDDDGLDQFIARLEAFVAIEGEVVDMGEDGEGAAAEDSV